MPDWQERITRDTDPAIRVEHELRYALAAPLVGGASLWCDLGSGSGVAAAAALAGGEPPARTVLVDIDRDALEQAARELRMEGATTVQADLSSAEGLERVRAELLEHAGAGVRCVTCFEALEHLSDFVPLVGLLAELADRHGFTVALSVPNDAFWSLENPHHHGSWGEGAFEELTRLLPRDQLVLRQVQLQGSALARTGDGAGPRTAGFDVDPQGVATHLIVVFGAERDRVSTGVSVVQADLAERRRWERQRESDLRYLQQYVSKLEGDLEKANAEITSMSGEFAEWRAYIHDLERRLGLPLSGNGDGPGETSTSQADRPKRT